MTTSVIIKRNKDQRNFDELIMMTVTVEEDWDEFTSLEEEALFHRYETERSLRDWSY